MNVGITGMRDLDAAGKDWWTIRARMRRLVETKGILFVYFGGARGADSVALFEFWKYRRDHPGIAVRTVLVLPGRKTEMVKEAALTLAYADEVVELRGDVARPASYHKRNDYIIKNSQAIIGFWDEKTLGGTSSTLEKAEAAGKDVEIVTILGASKGKSSRG